MLEIRSLGKVYPGGTVALRDFSLGVGEGVLGLLGPNGAGKTTLLSILATLTRPTSGTFLWDGADGVHDPLAVRRRLGFLPQDFGVYESLTAREVLSGVAPDRQAPGATPPAAPPGARPAWRGAQAGTRRRRRPGR